MRAHTTALLLALAACSSAPPASSDGVGWFGTAGVTRFVLFPQLPEPPDRTHHGSGVPADPEAPACPPAEPTHATHAARISLPRRDLPSLELQLPTGYDLDRYEHSPGHFEQTGEHWGGLLGSIVSVAPTPETGRYDQGPSFWLGGLAGYPTAGLEPGTVQTSFSECQRQLGSTTLRLVRYRTRSPRGEEHESVAAYWQLADSVVLTAASMAASAEELASDLAVIHSVQFVP